MTTITEADYRDAADSYLGWCRTCQEFTTDSCEPDARRYECPECGERTVYGAEEALMMGCFTF
ncbi:MAG: hypothetical protein Q8S13_08430 [Dehalococcoidia bacterium]|nr:hypothetical protein [Dehalococcoidia bacterium]